MDRITRVTDTKASVVLGTLVLVVITVAMAATVGGYLLATATTYPPAPSYTASAEYTPDALHITINSASNPQPLTVYANGTRIGEVDSPTAGDVIAVTGVEEGTTIQFIAENSRRSYAVYQTTIQYTVGNSSTPSVTYQKLP